MIKLNIDDVFNSKETLIKKDTEDRIYTFIKEHIGNDIYLIYRKEYHKSMYSKKNSFHLNFDCDGGVFEYTTTIDAKNKICYNMPYPFESKEYNEKTFSSVEKEIKQSMSELIYDYSKEHLNELLKEEKDLEISSNDLQLLEYYYSDYQINNYNYALNRKYQYIEYLNTNILLNWLLNKNMTIQHLLDDFIVNSKKELGRFLKRNEMMFSKLDEMYHDENCIWRLNKEIYNALLKIPKAKTVKITIEINGNQLDFKYLRYTLKTDLLNNLSTRDYNKEYCLIEDFINQNIKDNTTDRGRIRFEYIQKITYGKQVIYKK